MKDKVFKRGNGTSVSYDEMTKIIAEYIAAQPFAEYEITVGTDSQSHSKTKLVEVIAVHRVGAGGIFFYRTEYVDKIRVLKEKIIEETARSIDNATGLLDEISVKLIDHDIDIDDLNVHFQIHCDIGHYGKTSALISEITNWVESMGYEVAIKPDSYTASGIANKISK